MDPGKRLQAPGGPTQDGPSQVGAVATLLDPGPSSLLFSVGVTITCSQRDSEVLIGTQVTVLTQRWPSPGSTGENFPAGKRDWKWDPSEDWFQGAVLLEVLGSTARPCCCTCITYMRSTGKGAHRAGQALASCWGPSPLTSLQHAAGGGDSCLSPAGEVAGALTVVCGMLDPEQGEESHIHWSEKRARVHPGSTQSGVSLPETLPPGFRSLLTIHLHYSSA